MKTETGVRLERFTDPSEERADPYGEKVEGGVFGKRARQYELAKEIWKIYFDVKHADAATQASPDWKAESGVGAIKPHPSTAMPIERLDWTLSELVTIVSKDKLAKSSAKIRAEDITMLEKIANRQLTEDEKYLHAEQIEFLTGVLGIIDELSKNKLDVLTCGNLARTFREEAMKFVVTDPGSKKPEPKAPSHSSGAGYRTSPFGGDESGETGG